MRIRSLMRTSVEHEFKMRFDAPCLALPTCWKRWNLSNSNDFDVDMQTGEMMQHHFTAQNWALPTFSHVAIIANNLRDDERVDLRGDLLGLLTCAVFVATCVAVHHLWIVLARSEATVPSCESTKCWNDEASNCDANCDPDRWTGVLWRCRAWW